MTRKQPIFSMGISSDEKEIMTGEHEIIYLQENPLKCENFRIIGPEDSIIKFLAYMKSILSEENPDYDPEMDNFIIVPEFFNSIHIYAYLNLREYLQLSLDHPNPPFISSRDNFHPLSICLIRELKGVRDDVVRSFCVLGRTNPFILLMIEDNLIEMNRLGFSLLKDLYEVIYQEVARKSLPKFCAKEVSLPITHISDYFNVRPNELFEDSMLASQGIGISFYESYIRINFNLGSTGSIEFLESLAGSPNTDILRTDLVQQIIRYKWKTAKYTMIYQASVFFIYMLSLCFYTLFFMGNLYYLICLFIFNLFLIAYEFFQLMISGSSYFTDFMNYID